MNKLLSHGIKLTLSAITLVISLITLGSLNCRVETRQVEVVKEVEVIKEVEKEVIPELKTSIWLLEDGTILQNDTYKTTEQEPTYNGYTTFTNVLDVDYCLELINEGTQEAYDEVIDLAERVGYQIDGWKVCEEGNLTVHVAEGHVICSRRLAEETYIKFASKLLDGRLGVTVTEEEITSDISWFDYFEYLSYDGYLKQVLFNHTDLEKIHFTETVNDMNKVEEVISSVVNELGYEVIQTWDYENYGSKERYAIDLYNKTDNVYLALVVETYPGEADYGTCYQIALNVMHGNYLALGQ